MRSTMEKFLLLLWTVLGSFLPCCILLDQASFYGSSYISIPLREAKSSTDIEFKFRTRLANAIILLVAGTTDYCLVKLDDGQLKITINLGAGEADLASHIKLNDDFWHHVYIIRQEANLTMIIDNVHTVKKKLPGKFFELNINFGLHIAGHANHSELYFGHVTNFRGCLSKLIYNGIPVLEHARKRQSQAVVRGVTWNCATEFDSDVDRPISFVEDGAFMTIPTKPQLTSAAAQHQLKLQLELKTLNEHGCVVYNPGTVAKHDFFAVEVWGGRVKATLRHGDRTIENTNEELVSDGHWHTISVRLTLTYLDLNVDANMKSLPIQRGHYADLERLLYVGGVETTKRTRAMSRGMKTSDSSFRGCIKHISFGETAIGLPDVLVSESVLSGCLWNDPCQRHDCNNDQCQLESIHCSKTNSNVNNATEDVDDRYSAVLSRTSLATDLQLLLLEPLEVSEGENELITASNLHMVLDYPKYGIRDTGVRFTLIKVPEHGSVRVDVWSQSQETDITTFTLADVVKDKVHYLHDGSEHHKDFVSLQVEFIAGEKYILPAYLQGKFKFNLLVNVLPMNDSPVLKVTSASVLRLAQNTKKIVDPELFHVEDPDTASDQIVYNILDSGPGHFERSHKPDSIPLNRFTQYDIDEGRIAYVHVHSINKTHVTVQVSDGIETSALVRLRVTSFPQHWRLLNNTGLVLMYQSAALITPFNISFVSNVANASDRAQYNLEKDPQFGVVEVEKEVGVWESATMFTNSDVKQHRVRYRHTTLSNPDFDEFQFRTTLNMSMLYTFRLTFTKCQMSTRTTNKTLILDENGMESVISLDHLQFQTEPILSDGTAIVYLITKKPKYGFLMSSVSRYQMNEHDYFTQEDLFAGNVKYRFYRKPYSVIRDRIVFTVSVRGCGNATGNFFIEYRNPEKSDVQLTFQRVRVPEGGIVNISSEVLDIRFKHVSRFFFNITIRPTYGSIRIVNAGVIVHNHTDSFTSDELSSGQVFYSHDDSESRHDSFEVMALSSPDENFQYVHTLYVDINLRNDNGPVRAVDRIFQVVVGGQKLLTGDDLRFTDADIDTKLTDIIYSCRDVANGEIYNAKNASVKMNEFTQADLENGAVLFKHKGTEYGKLKLSVTDGHYYVNGVLEIQASAPFIRISTNKRFIVPKGNWSYLGAENLSYETNLFATDKDVIYKVTSSPIHGRLFSSVNRKEVNEFRQSDINNRLIYYTNEVSSAGVDEIGLKVQCRDVITIAKLGVRILPGGYWEPLKIKTARALMVEESTSAIIAKSILEVNQPNVPAAEITYHISEYPMHGYIDILPSAAVTTTLPVISADTDESMHVRTFTQSQLNDNRLIYIQAVANETHDRIAFNVTSGMVWLRSLTLEIQIIPERLYLGSITLNVNEGGAGIVYTSNLFVVTEYYISRVTDYIVLEGPRHGCLQIHRQCIKLQGFSHKELLASAIHYANNGSESRLDEVTLVAVAGQKRSIPVVLSINILPVNDQKPVLVNNTGLTMYEGGMTVIANEMLGAIDADLPKESIRYQIVSCWWGNVTLNNNHAPLQVFTQELIDKNAVQFQHLNGTDAKFIFTITDGLHTSREYTFHIKTKPVLLAILIEPLHIFPLQRKYITSVHLHATASDPQRNIIYEIVSPPTLGRLMMESEMNTGIYRIVNTFTQSDLNNSRVFYEHTHPFADLYANDSVVFNIKAGAAQPILNRILQIDISVSSGGLDAYVAIPKIVVDEGGLTGVKLNISAVVGFLERHAGLRSPLIHSTVRAPYPRHGQVFLLGHEPSEQALAFTQQQLESGQVQYQHDHSDSLGDDISFALYLIPGYIPLCNVTVPVTINPINDQPFSLVTPAPNLVVVQGENHTLNRLDLCTEDADTLPKDLLYDIITGPMDGRVLLLPLGESINHFSQADVDSGRLVYCNNGSMFADSLHLRVWDGKFRPEYTVLNVQILPVKLTVGQGRPVYLQQGSNVALLSEKQFIIDTNANRTRLEYAFREEHERPKHGHLYVRDKPALKFKQDDLIDGQVMYMQTDMTTLNDTFTVFASITSGNSSVSGEVIISLRVQPLMQLGNLTVIAGETNRISLHVLDATPLAKLTNSNPRFSIVQQPRHGQVRKIIRSSGEHRNVLDAPVASFTHEEVQGGLLYVVVDDIEVGWGGVRDKLVFVLAASIFQPAVGELQINIRSSLINDIYSTLAGPNDPAGHEGGMHFASPNMTRDYFLIVSMVAGVIVLGIAVIVIIKCRSFVPEAMHKEEQCLQPIPLPRPPDRLMNLNTSPPMKQHVTVDDGFTSPSPIPTTLPHCKVTPLSRSGSDLDNHHNLARYPYGVDDHMDDWSSCDPSDPSCPSRNNIMLRRNQYWV